MRIGRAEYDGIDEGRNKNALARPDASVAWYESTCGAMQTEATRNIDVGC